MKKIVVLLTGIVALGTLAANAQTTKKKITISNTRIVQAAQQATTVRYAGTNITVPQGQTILLGQRSDGAIVIRGKDLSGLKIENSTVSTKGYSVFSVVPEHRILFLNRGTELTVQDPSGTRATIFPGQAVSAEYASITSETAPLLQAAAEKEAALAAEVEATVNEVPAFVAENTVTSAASEQATQDVVVTEEEDLLSPSAP